MLIAPNYHFNKIHHSSFLLFHPKLLYKIYKLRQHKKMVIINVCPSTILAFLESVVCKVLKIQYVFYPFKIGKQRNEIIKSDVRNVIQIINCYELANVWLHCFWGVHRTGLIVSMLNNKRSLYTTLCVNNKKKQYMQDITILNEMMME